MKKATNTIKSAKAWALVTEKGRIDSRLLYGDRLEAMAGLHYMASVNPKRPLYFILPVLVSPLKKPNKIK